jgi:hypothetical protein
MVLPVAGIRDPEFCERSRQQEGARVFSRDLLFDNYSIESR